MLHKIIFTILLAFSNNVFAYLVYGENPAQEYDVRKSWEQSVVHVPGNFLTKTVDTVNVSAAMPVVVFLHGCAGIGVTERRWADFLKAENFIVVLLNSYAIDNREKNCIPATRTTNIGKVPVNSLRPAEAEYAMSKLKEKAWADKNNIFLMGHSEGGMGTFLTRDVGFSGIVITGFVCFLKRPFASSKDTPTLIINYERDPFFEKPDRDYLQCSDKFYWSFRTNTKEILLPGRGHGSADNRTAQEAVTTFLKNNIK